jgi:hypothetical protein
MTRLRQNGGESHSSGSRSQGCPEQEWVLVDGRPSPYLGRSVWRPLSQAGCAAPQTAQLQKHANSRHRLCLWSNTTDEIQVGMVRVFCLSQGPVSAEGPAVVALSGRCGRAVELDPRLIPCNQAGRSSLILLFLDRQGVAYGSRDKGPGRVRQRVKLLWQAEVLPVSG